MMEPTFRRLSTGEVTRYSDASSEWLREFAGNVRYVGDHPEDYDSDFRRRYAAILLKERGL